MNKKTIINPHYFGDFPLRKKNKKTRFFITSTSGRKFDILVNATEQLKNEGLDFEILVVGRAIIDFHFSEIVKNNYIFKLQSTYKEMFNELEKSDYVILPLDPKKDQDYKTQKTSGSVQLAYGFLKPLIIHKEFADCYKMTNENGFIYENNHLVDVLRNAIELTPIKYEEKQNSLKIVSDEIFNFSLENLKKMINYKN